MAQKMAKKHHSNAPSTASNDIGQTLFSADLETQRLIAAGADPMTAHLQVAQMIKNHQKYLTSPYMTDNNPDEIVHSASSASSSSTAPSHRHKLTQAEIFAKITGHKAKAKARIIKRATVVRTSNGQSDTEKAKIAARFNQEKAYFEKIATKQRQQHKHPKSNSKATAAMSKMMPEIIVGVVVLGIMAGLIAFLNKLDEDEPTDEERGPLAVGMKRASKKLQTGKPGSPGRQSPRASKSKQQYQQKQYQQKQQHSHQTIADSWMMVGEDTDLEFATNFEVSDEVM